MNFISFLYGYIPSNLLLVLNIHSWSTDKNLLLCQMVFKLFSVFVVYWIIRSGEFRHLCGLFKECLLPQLIGKS